MHFVDAKWILTGSGGHYGMNIYRGCTHGCIYCDSRSRCYQFTHPFEDIEVKQNAPKLLEKALKSKRKKCMIGTGTMSDPYMHCEENLRLTRKCLEIILENDFGVAIQTKSDRILRDIDLLSKINRSAKCVVQMTLTTYDDDSELECIVLNIFKGGDREYIALLPTEGIEAEEGTVYLYRYEEDEQGNPNLTNIESDEEYEIASDAFDEMLDDEEYDELVSEEELAAEEEDAKKF